MFECLEPNAGCLFILILHTMIVATGPPPIYQFNPEFIVSSLKSFPSEYPYPE